MKKYTILLVIALGALTSCHDHMVPMATTGGKIGSKTGVATGRKILGFGNINVSIEQAAKNGGITKVATVDYIRKQGFFTAKYTTEVTGE